jgi:hypothetical protein
MGQVCGAEHEWFVKKIHFHRGAGILKGKIASREVWRLRGIKKEKSLLVKCGG